MKNLRHSRRGASFTVPASSSRPAGRWSSSPGRLSLGASGARHVAKLPGDWKIRAFGDVPTAGGGYRKQKPSIPTPARFLQSAGVCVCARTCVGTGAGTRTRTPGGEERVTPMLTTQSPLQTPVSPAGWLGGSVGPGPGPQRLRQLVLMALPTQPRGRMKATAARQGAGRSAGNKRGEDSSRRRGGWGAAAPTDCRIWAGEAQDPAVGLALKDPQWRSAGPGGGGVL